MVTRTIAVVPGYYLVCYNRVKKKHGQSRAVVPGYYLVCYNMTSLLPLLFLL